MQEAGARATAARRAGDDLGIRLLRETVVATEFAVAAWTAGVGGKLAARGGCRAEPLRTMLAHGGIVGGGASAARAAVLSAAVAITQAVEETVAVP